MKITICSLFPEYFTSALACSTLARAKKSGQLDVALVDYWDFVDANSKRADDRPYGGGPGMVLRPEILVRALSAIEKTESDPVIYLTATGKPLTAQLARQLSQFPHLVFVCGHYEGIDQRALDMCVDEEISIGDFVLSSGCPAALVLCDAIARFLPGVLGHADSARVDSFEEGLLEGPQFTRPAIFEEKGVPRVLLSGCHRSIANWRRESALERTRRNRPDLLIKVSAPEVESNPVPIGDEKAALNPAFSLPVVARLPSNNLEKCQIWYARIWPFQWLWRGENCARIALPEYQVELYRVDDPLQTLTKQDVFFCAKLSPALSQIVWNLAFTTSDLRRADVKVVENCDGESGVKISANDPEGRQWIWNCSGIER